MPLALTQQQIDRFRRDGALTVEDAVGPDTLACLRGQFSEWVDESRAHDQAYGETIDGRPRFDLEPGHDAEHPALRRVNAPADISDAYFTAMSDSRMVDMVTDLIGPDVKHHHNKINSKLPGAATQVKWHQDFPYTPHSNADLVTALLMLDDVNDDNGALEVSPGSHTGPVHDLWHDGVFTGAVADHIADELKASSVKCVGPAGSVCLMHTRLAHGSAPNLSNAARTLFIAVYAAADAVPLSRNPVPNRHQGLVVRGQDSGRIRATAFSMRPAEYPEGASFFNQQARG